MSRRRLVCLLLLIPPLSFAAWAVADWWICLPADERAEYVGRDQCARCHQKEHDLWKDSDHDKAMQPAAPETVLGDFDDVEFTHIAFELIPKLTDDEFALVTEHIDKSLWAKALYNVAAPLKGNLLGRMSEATAAAVVAEIENFVTVRPCDSAVAQNGIADIIRGLRSDGKVNLDFAVTTRFFRRGEKYLVTTDGPGGRIETFQVEYVFGVRPLQQYLVKFPDGRMQCLPTAYDTIRGAWFHLYSAEPIPAGDVLHWTKPLQNWNYMCAECHSTDLRKNFDLADNSYDTKWSEIDVSCETCHGPGSLHVELAEANSLFWDRRIGFGLPNLKSEDSHVEIEACAPCHARRQVVYPDHKAGDKFLNHYLPQLLDNNLYYADGQLLEEDYVYGSFIQSLMYQKGVRCSDCHDSHTARVKHTAKDARWDALPENSLCTDCHMGTHPAGKYDTPAHHHHPDSSKPGTRCVECHMPETTYMVADPRRDHSIRSPRPDLTDWLAVPNACNGCHNDRSKGETPEWAGEQLRQWYGERNEPTHFAYAIAAGRELKPEGRQTLEAVTRRKDLSPTVRASAIALLGGYPSATGHAASLRGLEDPDALVRAAAVRSLQYLPAGELHGRLAPLLHDPIRSVRVEAARLLSRVPRHRYNKKDLRAFEAALAEYMTGQEAVGDQAPAHLNMAVVHGNLGDMKKSEQEYRTSIRLDPQFVPARVNLAMLCDQLNRKDEAAELFRKVIELEPNMAEAHYSLGLLLAEKDEQLEEAAKLLGTAARFAPENARIHYNHALALQKLKRFDEAERELAAAYRLAPGNSDYLYALAILYSQQKRWARAVACAEELVRTQPNNRQMLQLLEYAKREAAAEPE